MCTWKSLLKRLSDLHSNYVIIGNYASELRYCLEHISGFSEAPFWLWIWSATHWYWQLTRYLQKVQTFVVICQFWPFVWNICSSAFFVIIFFFVLPIDGRSAVYVGKLYPLWGKWFAAKLHIYFLFLLIVILKWYMSCNQDNLTCLCISLYFYMNEIHIKVASLHIGMY